jgi:hypothetical protein
MESSTLEMLRQFSMHLQWLLAVDDQPAPFLA